MGTHIAEKLKNDKAVYLQTDTDFFLQKENLTGKIGSCIDTFETELRRLDSHVFEKLPIDSYVQDVTVPRPLRPNRYWSPLLKDKIRLLNKENGKAFEAMYHKLAFSRLMKRTLAQPINKMLPEGILSELIRWFNRILVDFKKLSAEYYSFGNADFKYDLSVCSQKGLPVGGAWFVQLQRMGLRPFLTVDAGRILKILGCLVYKTKGLSPFCIIHTFPRYALRFNCQNMELAYKNIGELLLRKPEIKGIYRRSWFLDPTVKTISPELAFLRETPLQNGGVFFEASTQRADIDRALVLSRRRRAMYAQGKYNPAAYAYIWPRKEFLGWYHRILACAG